MKKYLGPFLLLLSFQSQAETSAMLMLRAIVPPVTKIEIKMEGEVPKAIIHSNQKNSVQLPELKITKLSTHYLISVRHP